MWTPGFGKRVRPEGYYWVPGTWVSTSLRRRALDPRNWGWANGAYAFNEGYWGPHIGFYGAVNYGFGYGASDLKAGNGANGGFSSTTALMVNIGGGVRVTNVYEKTVMLTTTPRQLQRRRRRHEPRDPRRLNWPRQERPMCHELRNRSSTFTLRAPITRCLHR